MSQSGHYSLRKIQRSAGHFLAGKLVGSVLTLSAFALTARLLGARHYGAYAALLAAAEVMMSLAALGIDWLTGRYLPEYRSRGDRHQLRRLLVSAFATQAAVMIAIALVVTALSARIAPRLGIADGLLVGGYAMVFVLEGSARIVRDQFLPLLLAQGSAQIATLMRSGSLVLMLWLAHTAGTTPASGPLVWVVGAEALAALLSLCVGVVALRVLVRRHVPDATHAIGTPWQPPPAATLVRFARNAYVSTLLVVPAGGAALTLVIGALAGTQAAGAFGFARSLVDQVRRFLPIELFLSLIRAGVTARYAVSRDFAALNLQLGLAFGVSVVAAMPILAVMIGQGSAVAAAIGGAGFDGAASVLTVWSISLLLFPHRRTAELVAYTTDQSHACVKGGLMLAASPLAVAALLASGVPCAPSLGGALVADLGFSVVVVHILRRAGLPYRLPQATLTRLAALQVVAIAAVAGLPTASPAAGVQLAIGCATAVACTWGLGVLTKPFAAVERAAVNAVLPRPWFPF